MFKPNILIASNSQDSADTRNVAAFLEKKNYNVLIYEADKVALGQVPLNIEVHPSHGLRIQYNHREFRPEDFSAAWCRRPDTFGNIMKAEDKARRLCVDNERSYAQATLWYSIPVNRWLNSFDAVRNAERKILQLATAREVGFSIPSTLIANSWQEIRDKFVQGKIIFKSFRGILYAENDYHLSSTVIIDLDKKCSTEVGMPFPGIWQRYIPKRREWRITVVGDNVFDAAIYTSEEAKDDWRVHQLTSQVEFRSEKFPDSEKEKCLQLLKRYNLRFGAFDFIEDNEGLITFLEVNPSGQYGWLEKLLGLPISNAIAAELIKIQQG